MDWPDAIAFSALVLACGAGYIAHVLAGVVEQWLRSRRP